MSKIENFELDTFSVTQNSTIFCYWLTDCEVCLTNLKQINYSDVISCNLLIEFDDLNSLTVETSWARMANHPVMNQGM